MADKFKRIVVGVIAVVTNEAGEVLFVKQRRGPYHDEWILPGGGIKYLEKVHDAVKREVLEESGIEIELHGYFSAYEMIGTWENGDYHLIMHCYDTEALNGVPPYFKNDEVDGAQFFSLDGFKIHPTDLRILTDSKICPFYYPEAEIQRELREAGILMRRLY